MPWLAMTAFVHSIMVQKRRGMFRMWNMALIIVAFTMAQMGMFINRGGPVPSVHSFAQSTMGWLFLAFMAGTLLASIAVFLWRYDSLKSRAQLEAIVSRESAFLGQNILFLAVAFCDTVGHDIPSLQRSGGRHGHHRRPSILRSSERANPAAHRGADGHRTFIAVETLNHPEPGTRPPRAAHRRAADSRSVADSGRAPARRARGVRISGLGSRRHPERVAARYTFAAPSRRGVSCCVPQPAGRQPPTLRRLHRASGHSHACSGRNRLIFLQRAARHRYATRRCRGIRRLHLQVCGSNTHNAPGQRGVRCSFRCVEGRPTHGKDGGVPSLLSHLPHRLHQGRDPQHPYRGLLHSAPPSLVPTTRRSSAS